MNKIIAEIGIEDEKIFSLIECQRENIINQNISIDLMDYGAGDPKSNRSKEESYQGVVKRTTTKKQCAIGLKGDYAKVLYSLVKKYKPKKVLELGTCCGFSSIYMAKASTKSNIYTIEGDINVAKIAKNNIESLNCNNIYQKVGKFQDVLTNVLKEIEVVDFAFIDGHHDKDATIEYFNVIKPFLSNDAIVVFDDISWSSGMIESWEILKKDKKFIKYDDLKKLGICYCGGDDDLV